jgi:hypothetical protein
MKWLAADNSKSGLTIKRRILFAVTARPKASEPTSTDSTGVVQK